MKKAIFIVSVVLCVVFLSSTAFAWDDRGDRACSDDNKSRGQTIYVPAPYEVFTPPPAPEQWKISLLTITNTDRSNSIYFSGNIYAPDGSLFRPTSDPSGIELGPHQSINANILLWFFLGQIPEPEFHNIFETVGYHYYILEWWANRCVSKATVISQSALCDVDRTNGDPTAFSLVSYSDLPVQVLKERQEWHRRDRDND